MVRVPLLISHDRYVKIPLRKDDHEMKNKEALTIKTLIHELSKFPKDCWDLPIKLNILGERLPGQALFFSQNFTKANIINDFIEGLVEKDEEISFWFGANEIEDDENPSMLLEDYIDFENLEERVIQKYKRNKKKKGS